MHISALGGLIISRPNVCGTPPALWLTCAFMDRLSCVVLVGLDRTAKFTEALQNSLTPRMRAPTLWGLWMLAWGVGGTNAEIFNLRGLDPLYRAPLSL